MHCNLGYLKGDNTFCIKKQETIATVTTCLTVGTKGKDNSLFDLSLCPPYNMCSPSEHFRYFREHLNFVIGLNCPQAVWGIINI